MSNPSIPATQYAVQLTGPGKLELNTHRIVPKPGPHQILARIECVGLCFSDLKLLKQFSAHARKSEIISGLPKDILSSIPSYVPGEKPTVPGHEVACRIVAIGERVEHHKVGQRCLVQTDYRALPTASSNAAFGYNFEGALQEYVLMDERVVIDRQSGDHFLIPVPEDLGASAIALVEPWACVENSYVNEERQQIKPGGRLLVVREGPSRILDLPGKTGNTTTIEPSAAAIQPDESFDDIIYFGSDRATIEILNDKLASRGIINNVLDGKRIGSPVSVGIGRVHYGMTRWIGTTGSNPADSYRNIPRNGELRAGESLVVIGAGGPMGQMHVIRSLCAGTADLSVVGADVDDARLDALAAKAQPLATLNGVGLQLINTQRQPLDRNFSYWALMAPIGALVADAVSRSDDRALINIFAGIPAPTKQLIDLDTYISNRCFMFGTSGSVIRDMKIVLQKVRNRQLDTNCSVDAVSGMAGAVDGIAAVENRTLAGKIIVYPMLHDLGLTPLTELPTRFPTVAARLDAGKWTADAEAELLRVAGNLATDEDR